MNDIMQKLYQQAFSNYMVGAGFDTRSVSRFDLEKYTKLIVRECMNIADGQKKYVEDMEVFNEQDANWNRARIQQSQQIIDNIKKHFGVE